MNFGANIAPVDMKKEEHLNELILKIFILVLMINTI